MQTIESKNSIKKLQVAINTNSVTKAMEIKDNIDSFIKNEIYPEIDAILKKYSKEIQHNTIQLDTITIDISESNYNDIKSTLKDKLDKSIESATLKNKKIPENTISGEEKKIKALLFFLENGQLPWWYTSQEFFKTEDIKSLKNSSKYHTILTRLLRKKNVQKRVIYQLNFEQIEALVFASSKTNYTVKYPLNQKLINRISNNQKSKFWSIILTKNFTSNQHHFEENIYKEIAEVLQLKSNQKSNDFTIKSKQITQLATLVNYINILTKSSLTIAKNDLNKICLHLKSNSGFQAVLQQNIDFSKIKNIALTTTFYYEKTSARSSQNTSNNNDSEIATLPKNISINKDVHKNTASNKTKEELNLEDKEQNTSDNNDSEITTFTENISIHKDEHKDITLDKIKEELTFENKENYQNTDTKEILVQNAGLILLHPFLKQFFTKLGFYEKGEKQIKQDKIDEATQLLHFLATKNEAPYEYELSFEKFLCGIPFNEPINRLQKISSAQKKECSNLLESVINHWKALKTSNIDTLRSGFLMREGKLTKETDSNKIFIQRQAHDILLERLPWGLSIMNLPWIKNITFIEW